MKKQLRSTSLETLIQGYILHAEASRYREAMIHQYKQIFRDFIAGIQAPTLNESIQQSRSPGWKLAGAGAGNGDSDL